MIASLAVILLCQLLGEVTIRFLGWPVPGPVMGMAYLVLLLSLQGRFSLLPKAQSASLEATGKTLLANLSLMFIPAGVGIVQKLDIVMATGFAIAVALIVSTLLTLLVTAGTFLAVSRLMRSPAVDKAEP